MLGEPLIFRPHPPCWGAMGVAAPRAIAAEVRALRVKNTRRIVKRRRLLQVGESSAATALCVLARRPKALLFTVGSRLLLLLALLLFGRNAGRRRCQGRR